MAHKRTFLKRWILICGVGLVMGILPPEEFSEVMTTRRECITYSAIGFSFFILVQIFGAIVEKTFFRFANGFRKMANQNISPIRSQTDELTFKSIGGFLISFGCGMIISAIWKETLLFWQGLAVVSGGLGVFIGVDLAARILKR